MRYLTFSEQPSDEFPVCFLVPELSMDEIKNCYIGPYLNGEEDHLIAYNLKKGEKKTPAAMQKEYLAMELLPTLRELGVTYLVVCDAEYFRTLTKGQGPEKNLGYVIPSSGEFKDENKEVHSFEGFQVVYCPNYNTVFYDEVRAYAGIKMGMEALTNHIQGSYVRPGEDIIHHEEYPETVDEIEQWLSKIKDMDCPLTSDIEGFSLKHYDAGIGSITFCWNQNEGVSFGVDLIEGEDGMPIMRSEEDSQAIRAMLRDFFYHRANTKREVIWHNIGYDAYVLIYQLYMDHILDTEGLLTGLSIVLADGAWEDTKHIIYLATNSCAGNKLDLKSNAQEYAGNYAVEEIKDITKLPYRKLLRYNLVDGLSTWYVFNKYYPIMVEDDQLEIYEGLFKNSTVDIVQMQLTGLPVDRSMVVDLQKELQEFTDTATANMMSNTLIDDFLYQKRLSWIQKENKKLKTIKRSMDDARKKVSFNPNSPDDLKELLYDEAFMALPILDLTDTKEPATGGKTLKKLRNHTDNDEHKEFIDALIDYKAVNKLLTSFIPAMLNAQMGPDGWHYLFGNFNLGGTVSGRLSSSGPNLQNLPANGYWAKKIKACFRAPPGFLFIGLDFASLEDRISALQTKDPQKLKVYTDGYDGHSLRAYSYFGEQMPSIDPESVESINSIADIHKPLRQDSKTPTFLLTYGGTWRGIVDQMGWPEDKAKGVESSYHDLYTVSDDWVEDQIKGAADDGYVTCAFGLRVRTPLLAKTILGTKATPYEAEAESRTAGNALGQSYCMLNSRAGNEFMRKVRKSDYKLDIRPCAHIHDAQYFIIPEDMTVLHYVNKHLVKAVEWQDDPKIYHDEVKLGGEVSIFYPSWAEELEIPNGASSSTIKDLAYKHALKYSLV